MDFFQSTYVPLMGFTAIFLQFGMTLLHAAYARDKTFKSVMTKNMIGLFVSVLIWWFWGFGFATGQTKNNLSPASSTFNGISGWFLLGLVYCIYCASIVCSAVGDRMAAWAYWALVIVIAGAAFPLIFNWIWTANVDEFNGSGWLLKEGAVDYAGSGIVNLVGAVAAVTSVAVLGPREGRFITENGMRKVQTFLPYNAVAGTTGTLVHVFAWMAYLAAAAAIPAFGGRGNAYNSATAAQIASRSVTMAVIAVAAGCFVSTLGLCHLKGKVTYSLPLINETVVGSLVAISAGAPLVEGYGAFFIGVVSGT